MNSQSRVKGAELIVSSVYGLALLPTSSSFSSVISAEIIRMDTFKKGPGSVHSVATARSNFSMSSQRSRATQKSWGSQRSRTPYRNRSSSRGRRSRSRTPARFPQQIGRNGSTVSFPVFNQKRKMGYRYKTSSGKKNRMFAEYVRQSKGSYPYNQSSAWTRLQYAKNKVRLAKQTLNRSQKIYIQQLKELQQQIVSNTTNYNTSPQFRFRNNFQKEANRINPMSSPAPKQSLTVCITNELALRNLPRAQGGKILPKRNSVGYINKVYFKNLSAGKAFQSPVSLQNKFVFKKNKPYENELEKCPGIVPWDTITINVPSVTSSSLNDRFSKI